MFMFANHGNTGTPGEDPKGQVVSWKCSEERYAPFYARVRKEGKPSPNRVGKTQRHVFISEPSKHTEL